MTEKFKKFAENLNSDDIDLTNKLSNMCDSEITSELVNMIENDKGKQQKIEEYIKRNIYQYEDDIVKEALRLFDEDLIDTIDYSSGLYNTDSLYICAIAYALGFLYFPVSKYI